jgi:hypothetical protein
MEFKTKSILEYYLERKASGSTKKKLDEQEESKGREQRRG